MTPENEARLKEAHNLALQRILSFENAGGGFGWYAGRTGNALLTAYAVMFLSDLAKLYEFDRGVLERSVAWLEKSQDPEGRWVAADGHASWRRLSDAGIPSTAYVAWALRRAGREDTRARGRAEEFLRRARTEDAYALALVANAFPWKENLERLAALARDAHWTTRLHSWNRACGPTADVETTALAVLALSRHAPALADQAAGWLVRRKDGSGTWGSTQATILALQALTAVGGGAKAKAAARLWVNGKEIPSAFIETDQPQSFDVSPHLRTGTNEVTVESASRVNAQVAGRYYVPWGAEEIRGVEGLNLQVSYDRAEAKVGDVLTCTVKVEADSFMVMAEVAVPPGFTVDSGALDDLVRRGVVDKVAPSGRSLTFYLPGKSVTFSYPLRPRYPAQVSVPRSVAYEYYAPDRKVVSPPQELTVAP